MNETLKQAHRDDGTVSLFFFPILIYIYIYIYIHTIIYIYIYILTHQFSMLQFENMYHEIYTSFFFYLKNVDRISYI